MWFPFRTLLLRGRLEPKPGQEKWSNPTNESPSKDDQNAPRLVPQIPLKLVRNMLSLLDGKLVAQLSVVCKDWARIMSLDDDLWMNLFEKDFGKCSRKPDGMSWRDAYMCEFKWRSGDFTERSIDGYTFECLQLHDGKVLGGSVGGPVVLDIETGECIASPSGKGDVDMFAVTCFESDGRWLVGGSSVCSEIRIWDLETEECVKTLEGHPDGVSCLAVQSSPPKLVVSGASDGLIKVWDVESGVCMKIMRGHAFTVSCLALNGEYVVSGSCDRTIKVWPIKYGQCMETWQAHDSAVTQIEFDGRTVVSGSFDETVKVWDMSSSECCMTLEHSDEITALKSVGRWVVTLEGDCYIKVWELDTGKCIRQLEGPKACNALSLDFDGRSIVCGFDNNTIRVWSVDFFETARQLGDQSCSEEDEGDVETVVDNSKNGLQENDHQQSMVVTQNHDTDISRKPHKHSLHWVVTGLPFVVAGLWVIMRSRAK